MAIQRKRNGMEAGNTTAPTSAQAVSPSDDHPFVRKVRDYAERTLRPTALQTEREGVTAGRIQELRELGLLNHLAPDGYGGLDRNADRRVQEIMAGACFNTWLVWAQHASLTARLAESAKARKTLPDLARKALAGKILLGAGVSDVRSFPTRYIEATRTDGGWIFSGTISWVSGWGLSSALSVAAVEKPTETVVTALVEVGERTRAAAHLDLAAVAGSRTERVILDDVFVPDEHVISQQTLEQTRFNDIGIASDARSHHFGLAETVLRELEEAPDPLVQAVAATWRPRVARIRKTAYALSDEAAAAGGGPYQLGERLATKVASGEALATLTRALVVARAGRGLSDGDTAQLHARSALFVLVQGQSADVRRAQLTHLAR
jgi:alkylation response protein AidB-like acyl-CoA dehydrogenase